MAVRTVIVRGIVFLMSGALGVVLVLMSPYRAVFVTGGSMSPVLEVGDLCIVHRGLRPEIGSVTLIDRGGAQWVLHRIVARDGQGFMTRGDANGCDDREPVMHRDIDGVVVWRLRLTGSGGVILRVDM